MGMFSWLVVGAITGWLAGLVVKGRGYGCIGDVIVGVIGGLLGGWLGSYLFHFGGAVSGINWQSLLVAFAGAVIFAVILRLLAGKRN